VLNDKYSSTIILCLIDRVVDYLNNGFTILLESDLVGLLMHSYLSDSNLDAKKIHIDTRIKQSNDAQKIDFAIGEVRYSDFSRPFIQPTIVIELKAIPEFGFTQSQKSKRFQYVLSDIEKLKKLNLSLSRWIVIFDGDNYFNNEKMKKIIQHRNEQDRGIEMVVIKKENQKWTKFYYT